MQSQYVKPFYNKSYYVKQFCIMTIVVTIKIVKQGQFQQEDHTLVREVGLFTYQGLTVTVAVKDC